MMGNYHVRFLEGRVAATQLCLLGFVLVRSDGDTHSLVKTIHRSRTEGDPFCPDMKAPPMKECRFLATYRESLRLLPEKMTSPKQFQPVQGSGIMFDGSLPVSIFPLDIGSYV